MMMCMGSLPQLLFPYMLAGAGLLVPFDRGTVWYGPHRSHDSMEKPQDLMMFLV